MLREHAEIGVRGDTPIRGDENIGEASPPIALSLVKISRKNYTHFYGTRKTDKSFEVLSRSGNLCLTYIRETCNPGHLILIFHYY